jgi:hypothetical protein
MVFLKAITAIIAFSFSFYLITCVNRLHIGLKFFEDDGQFDVESLKQALLSNTSLL